MILRSIVISLLLSLSPVTNAAEWVLLQHASLIGDWPGFDLLWGTPDDLDGVPGINPEGAATAFGETNGTLGGFGFLTGTAVANNGGAQNFGVNTITSIENVGVYDNNFIEPVDIVQNLIGVGSTTLNQDNTTSGSYVLDQPDPIETTTLSVNSFGSWITPSDDPETLFAGNDLLIGHYIFLLALLPTGWTALATSADFYTITSTNNVLNGITGVTSVVQYSLDPNASPAPVPIPAMLPMFIFALGGLWRLRRLR